MLNLVGVSDSNSSVIPSMNLPTSTSIILDIPTHDYYDMKLPEQNAMKYVCGYLIKKCTEKHICDVCCTYMNDTKAALDDTTIYCSFRAYNANETPFGKLHIANNKFCFYIQKLEEIFVNNFEKNCFQKKISNYLFNQVQDVEFEVPCPKFPKIYLLKLFIRMRIYFTVSHHNKQCKSTSRKTRKMLNILHL